MHSLEVVVLHHHLSEQSTEEVPEAYQFIDHHLLEHQLARRILSSFLGRMYRVHHAFLIMLVEVMLLPMDPMLHGLPRKSDSSFSPEFRYIRNITIIITRRTTFSGLTDT
jgi:hypothetical protein